MPLKITSSSGMVRFIRIFLFKVLLAFRWKIFSKSLNCVQWAREWAACLQAFIQFHENNWTNQLLSIILLFLLLWNGKKVSGRCSNEMKRVRTQTHCVEHGNILCVREVFQISSQNKWFVDRVNSVKIFNEDWFLFNKFQFPLSKRLNTQHPQIIVVSKFCQCFSHSFCARVYVSNLELFVPKYGPNAHP